MRLEGRRAVERSSPEQQEALGRVIAQKLAAEGADVAGLDLNAAGLEETAELVRAHGRCPSRLGDRRPDRLRRRTGRRRGGIVADGEASTSS